MFYLWIYCKCLPITFIFEAQSGGILRNHLIVWGWIGSGGLCLPVEEARYSEIKCALFKNADKLV